MRLHYVDLVYAMSLTDLVNKHSEEKLSQKPVVKQTTEYVWVNSETDYKSEYGTLSNGMIKRMMETTSFKVKDQYIQLPLKVIEEYSRIEYTDEEKLIQHKQILEEVYSRLIRNYRRKD